MTTYCLIEDGQITEGPRILPKSWRNVSGLNLASDESLKTLGWLPYIDNKPSYNSTQQWITVEQIIGEDSVTMDYTVHDYSSIFYTGQYCLVVDDVVVTGPSTLPKTHGGQDLYLMTDEEVFALGWTPYTSEDMPEYDADTQYLTSENVITEGLVTKTYTVVDYTPEEMAPKIETAKLSKLADLYVNVKRFIEYQPNGFIRYDSDLKMNIMTAIMNAMAAGQAKPANCALVETWIFTVQGEFLTLKATIAGAETLAAIREIDVSVDYFEGKYGREGTTLADPAISTSDLYPEE